MAEAAPGAGRRLRPAVPGSHRPERAAGLGRTGAAPPSAGAPRSSASELPPSARPGRSLAALPLQAPPGREPATCEPRGEPGSGWAQLVSV